MALDFPNNPSDGDEFNGFTYDASRGVWNNKVVSADGAAGGSSVTAYANFAAFPSTDNSAGDMAFAEDTKALYVWNGTEWDRVHSGLDEILEWVSEPNDTYDIVGDNSATVNFEAQDPDGFDIAYSYTTSPSNQTDVDIAEDPNGGYTLSRSSSSTGSGSIAMRVKATDGTFLISKTSTVTYSAAPPSVDYLIVAGGGGGGSKRGGGGGGGGLLSGTQEITLGTTYSIFVGHGGSGSGGGQNNAMPGGNSSAFGLTAIGGGKGGGYTTNHTGDGGPGGSGGGGMKDGTSNTGGAGTPGQGYDGGDASSSGGAGGGGAGGPGGNAPGGAGGIGVEWPAGSGNYYAGGGGGGQYNGSNPGGEGGLGGGGWGGGGAPSPSYVGTVGVDGTGGGGGGAGDSAGYTGREGGSGVVILHTTYTASATTGGVTVTQDGSTNIYTFTANGSITF